MRNKKGSEHEPPIKVVVQGALGRAGKAIIDILFNEPGIEIVGIVDLQVSDRHFQLPDNSNVLSSSNLEQILTTCKPDVLVDFTVPPASMAAVRLATRQRINLVIGTTGLTETQFAEIDRLCMDAGVGAITGAFSFGMALVAHLAAIASKYFDQAEIIDLSKREKPDAPSGCALEIAKAMSEAREAPFLPPPAGAEESASRGGQYHGVTIHSLRLSDCYIHDKIIFGTTAGTLVTLGLELTSEAYLNPAIVIAIKESVKHKGLIHGINDLLLGL